MSFSDEMILDRVGVGWGGVGVGVGGRRGGEGGILCNGI